MIKIMMNCYLCVECVHSLSLEESCVFGVLFCGLYLKKQPAIWYDVFNASNMTSYRIIHILYGKVCM